MKPLKSGIEYNSKELNDVKGGACACGCDILHTSTNGMVGGEFGECCYCDCAPDPQADMYDSAAKYV